MTNKSSFSKAAESYNQYANIQSISANTLMETIIHKTPHRILDIGCGTGLLTQLISKKYPNAHVDAMDNCPEMLQQLKQLNLHNVHIIKQNYISSTQSNIYDSIVSNAALHWMKFPQFLNVINSQLKPNGYCNLAIYGYQTSYELRHLLPKIGKSLALPSDDFPTLNQLQTCGTHLFKQWHIKTITKILTFKSIKDLLLLQRKTGVKKNRPIKGLWTPTTCNNLKNAYYDTYGQIQLTYDIHICSGHKPFNM